MPKIKSQYLDVIGILAIFGFFIFRYYNIISEEQVFSPFRDLVHFLAPEFSYVSQVCKSGEYPYWIQSMLGGVQFYDNAQFSVDYPFYFFKYWPYGIGEKTLVSLTQISLLHIFLLGVFTYILARVLKLSVYASVIGGCLHMLCLNTSVYAKWIVIICAYSWFPLYIAGLFLIYNKPKSFIGPVITAISILGFTANPAQPLIHAVFFGGILFVSLLLITKEKKRFILSGILTSFLTLGLNLMVFYPVGKNMEEMVRWVGKGITVVGNEKLPREVFIEALTLEDIHGFIFDTGINSVGSNYIGPIALCCFIFGIIYLIKSPSSKERSFILITLLLGIYALLSGFGDTFGFTDINYNIPLMDKIREPERHLFLFSLVSSVVAAYGLDKLNWKTKKSAIAYLVLLVLIITALNYDYKSDVWIKWTIYSSLATVILYSIITYFNGPLMSFKVLLLPLILTNGHFSTKGNIVENKMNWQYNKPNNLASMDVLKRLHDEYDKNYRNVYHDKKLANGLWSMNSLYFRLRSYQSQHVPVPFIQFKEMYNRDGLLNYRALTGAKYHIYEQSMMPDMRMKLLFKTELYDIYEDPYANKRAFTVFEIKPYSNGLIGLIQNTQNPEILNSVGFLPAPLFKKYSNFLDQVDERTYSSELIEATHNKFKYNHSAKSNSIFIFNEFSDENWKAHLDNDPVTILPINHNQLGIMVPSGEHIISFEYKPSLFGMFKIMRYLTLLIIVVLISYEMIYIREIKKDYA